MSDAVSKYLKVNTVGVPEMFQLQDRKGVRNMLAGDSALSPQERKRLLKTYDTYVDSMVNKREGGEVKAKPKKKASKKPRGAGVAIRGVKGTKFIGVR